MLPATADTVKLKFPVTGFVGDDALQTSMKAAGHWKAKPVAVRDPSDAVRFRTTKSNVFGPAEGVRVKPVHPGKLAAARGNPVCRASFRYTASVSLSDPYKPLKGAELLTSKVVWYTYWPAARAAPDTAVGAIASDSLLGKFPE
jgi:hypothetical protein